MKITHHDLMQLGTLLGYLNFEKGLCAGFSGMWVQAVLAHDESTFYARLAFIANYKNNFSRLVAEIKEAQQKQNKNLNEKDVQLLDILAFLDGVEMYLRPRTNRSYFQQGKYINQQMIQFIFSLVKPLTINESTIEVLLDKDYSFTKESLTRFFDDLAQLLSMVPSAIPIRLGSGYHSVCLKYNSQKSCWDYVDTNDFKKFSDVEQYVRELDTQALVESVFNSFRTNLYAVFNTKLITNYKEDKLKESLQKLNLQYPISAEEVNNRSSNGVDLFYISCLNGHLDTIKELLKPQYKVDINKADVDGVNPFYIACQQGHTEIIKELLKPGHKVDINKAANNGATPFYLACQNGYIDIIKELLKPAYKVDINKANNNKATPFYIACQEGHADIIKELLNPEYQVDINKADNNGVTPFYIVCYEGNTEIIKELLMPEYQVDINKADNDGLTPFYIACQEGHTDIIKELLKPEYRVDINKANNNGVTPFFITCLEGHTDVIKELLKPEYQVDINKADNNGVTPFYMACQEGNIEVVKELLALPHFTKIEAIGLTGHTPLLVACLSPWTKDKKMLFQELLKYGANIAHKNDDDETALDIAFSTGNQAAISELLQMAKINRYSLPAIMSSETLDKAKNWAKLNPELELNSYLQPLRLNNKLAFFESSYETNQPEMDDLMNLDAEVLL